MEPLFKALVALFIFLMFIAAPVASAVIAYSTDQTVNFTVKEKERVCSGSGDCRYLVFTEGEVYQNSDTIWYWKWNSSDVYGQLEEGKTYRAFVYGFRVPFMSWYKNIVSVEAL